MSGGLRMAATSTSTKLTRLHSKVHALNALRQDTPPQAAARTYQEQLQQEELLFDSLTQSVELLTIREQQWIQIVAADEKNEGPLFLASQQSGFLHSLEQGRDDLLVVAANVRVLRQTIQRIEARATQAAHVQPIAQPAQTAQPQPEQNQRAVPGLQLPKIELKQFNGNETRWPEFWAWFRSTVDNTDIPEPMKLTYLQNSLTGPALDLIAAYSLNAGTYAAVRQRLEQRYGDKEAIKHRLYEELEVIPSPSGTGFRQFTEQIERILELLTAQGEAVDTLPVQRTIEKKLPRWALQEIERERSSQQEWNVTKLRANLARQARSQARISEIMPLPVKQPTQGQAHVGTMANRFRSREMNAQTPPPTSAMITQSARQQNVMHNRHKRCIFCNRTNHWSDECRTVTSLAARRAKLTAERRCFRCLRTDHVTTACQNRRPCYQCRSTTHHAVLCDRPTTPQATRTTAALTQAVEEAGPEEAVVGISAAVEGRRRGALLWCREVTIENPQRPLKRLNVLAFMDSGSHRSFLHTEALELTNGALERLAVHAFAATDALVLPSHRVNIAVRCVDGTRTMLQANTVNTITAQPIEYTTDTGYLITDKKPQLLIGADYLFQFLKTNTPFTTTADGHNVIQTTLGPIVTGAANPQGRRRLNAPRSTATLACPMIGTHEKDTPLTVEPTADITQFWRLETIGVSGEELLVDEDEEAMAEFNNTVQREADGRIAVAFPRKRPPPDKPLSHNWGLCLGRLKSVISNLQAKQLLHDYAQIFSEQEAKGIIERTEWKDQEVNYILPHQAVVKAEKQSTKIRIVFDASAHLRGTVPVNEILARGPVILPNLAHVLFRWREAPIAVSADVEKAFLQLALREEDRRLTNFMWIKDLNKPPQTSNIQLYRFKRVPFGFICSPFLLAAAITHLMTQTGTPLAQEILMNVYVDNVFLRAEATEEAIEKSAQAKSYFRSALMNLREFVSNDESFNKQLKETDKSRGAVKALGLRWNIGEDTIELKLPDLGLEKVSQRKALAAIASLYDPLGLVSPLTIPPKLFLQQLWKEKYTWDKELSPELTAEWAAMAKAWRASAEFSLPRRIPPKTSQLELHVFVDASAKAYAAVAYIMPKGMEGRTTLVFSKARVAPVKSMTIPKLELMALVIGTRILNFIADGLQITMSKRIVWSDSQVVLHWLASKQQQSRFVENRLRECRNANAVFRHVPSEDNPADIASRGCLPQQLHESELWWHGPKWLPDEEEWPKNVESTRTEETESCDDLFGTEEPVTCVVHQQVQPFIDISRFSSWPRLQGTMATVLRARDCWLKRQKQSRVTYLQQAEQVLVRHAQQELMTDPKDHEELLTYTGRVSTAKKPLLLPREHHLTRLIIQSVHQQQMHAGVQHTLANFRLKFWCAQGRRTVTNVLRHCHGCKRWTAKPFRLPDMPDLPASRTTRGIPFSHCGVDYMGPIKVRAYLPGQELQPRWLVLFTCFATRAVHIELAKDYSAEACLNVFRRFFARRGHPKFIYTDNGTQLLAARKTILQEFAKLAEDANVQQHLQIHHIEWRTTVPKAPWQGGLYERLIGITKNAIRVSIGRKLLSEEELGTLATEAEAVVNSRPLIKVDDGEILRPVDFLLPRAQQTLPLPIAEDAHDPDYKPRQERNEVAEMWKNQTTTLNKFWHHWEKEYIQQLSERSGREHKGPRSENRRLPRLNETVLVYHENDPRGCWPLAIIEELHGEEGGQRSATIRMANGNRWKRPVNHLYSLEIADETSHADKHPADPNIEQEEADIVVEAGECRNGRSRRKRAGEGTDTRAKVPWIALCLCLLITSATPADASCHNPEGENKLWKTEIVLVREREPTREATLCRNTTRTICTESWMRISLSVTKDRHAIRRVSEKACRVLAKEKLGKRLKEIEPGLWTNHQEVSYDFGWWGEKCFETYQLQVVEGEIETTAVVEDARGESFCEQRRGVCFTADETIVWNPHQEPKCRTEVLGNFTAVISQERLVVKELQAAFPFGEGTLRCELNGDSIIKLKNGYGAVLKTEREANETEEEGTNMKGRSGKLLLVGKYLDNSDAENPKLQFLADKVIKEMHKLEGSVKELECSEEEELRRIGLWILEHDQRAKEEDWGRKDRGKKRERKQDAEEDLLFTADKLRDDEEKLKEIFRVLLRKDGLLKETETAKEWRPNGWYRFAHTAQQFAEAAGRELKEVAETLGLQMRWTLIGLAAALVAFVTVVIGCRNPRLVARLCRKRKTPPKKNSDAKPKAEEQELCNLRVEKTETQRVATHVSMPEAIAAEFVPLVWYSPETYEVETEA